jgi:hypothetical protein
MPNPDFRLTGTMRQPQPSPYKSDADPRAQGAPDSQPAETELPDPVPSKTHGGFRWRGATVGKD